MRISSPFGQRSASLCAVSVADVHPLTSIASNTAGIEYPVFMLSLA
ncbi:hypothetical protein AB0L82_07780 [Nocardia sp. NPDC052001]